MAESDVETLDNLFYQFAIHVFTTNALKINMDIWTLNFSKLCVGEIDKL